MSNLRRFAIGLLVAASLVFSPLALAEPSSVAREFFGLLESEDYTAAAQLFDPSELRELRELLRFVYENVENPNDELIKALFGANSTAESVSKLTDAEFFASFLALTMGEMKKSVSFGLSGVETLGHVTEGPDLAHVVTRFNLDMSEGGVSMIDVVSLRKVSGEWRILMQADMKAMANQIRAAYGGTN